MHARKHGDGHVDGHVRLASPRLMGFRFYVYVSSTSPYLFDIMPQDETTEATRWRLRAFFCSSFCSAASIDGVVTFVV